MAWSYSNPCQWGRRDDGTPNGLPVACFDGNPIGLLGSHGTNLARAHTHKKPSCQALVRASLIMVLNLYTPYYDQRETQGLARMAFSWVCLSASACVDGLVLFPDNTHTHA